MPLDSDFVMQHLQRLAPFESDEQARRIFDSVLIALAVVLEEDEAAELERELGPIWSPSLRRPRRVESDTLDAFYQRVGFYTGFRRSIAEELAQVCCRVLAAGLPESSVRRLQTALPQLARLFEPIVPGAPPDFGYSLRCDPLPDHTLAGGRPGATRPIADARPVAGPDADKGEAHPAHEHSPARSDEPHADTKLSSSHGLSQERVHRSLATARPRRDGPAR
jgi:uncharacterized protein (DUF2267 family)